MDIERIVELVLRYVDSEGADFEPCPPEEAAISRFQAMAGYDSPDFAEEDRFDVMASRTAARRMSRPGDREASGPSAPPARSARRKSWFASKLSVFDDIQQFINPDVMETVKGIVAKPDAGFSERLLGLIRERGMTEVACYTQAQVDRKLFSKIRSDRAYRPKKGTALAFALALGLDEKETNDLLGSAGYALSRSSKFDLAVGYCIRSGIRDVMAVNEILYRLDLPLL